MSTAYEKVGKHLYFKTESEILRRLIKPQLDRLKEDISSKAYEEILVSKDSKASYYDAGGIEVLDIIKAKLTPEQYRGYLLGNALKYGLRLNFKNEDWTRDAEKFCNYAHWLKEEVSK